MSELKNGTQIPNMAKECGKNFQCLQCYEYFRFRRHYDKHVEGHKKNNCKCCGKLYTVRKQLAIHLHEEHKIKLHNFKYNCQFCDKRFVKKLSLYQHYQQHAIGKKVCLHCGTFYSDMHELLKHQEKHKYEKPWKCDQCEEKFSRRQQYLLHLQGHEKYKCLTCKKSFSAHSKLAEHKKKGHEIKELEAKHVCEKCKRSFHLRRALVLHQRVHFGEKSFDCIDCNKNFSTKKLYSKHLSTAAHRGCENKVKTKQNKDKIFVCDLCGKIFKEKHALGLHIRRIHYREEPVKCSYCDYKSSCKANLKRHMEFHTEDRKFVCECCGASFHMLCTLKEHYLYVHSEERNFPCPMCDKSFKRKCGLNRHMRDHSENRPHVCHCGQSYKRMSHLKRHKESSHGMVSQPNKLCRLRRNELGILVPIVEGSIPKSKKKMQTNSSSKAHRKKTNGVTVNEETLDKEKVGSPQASKFHKAKVVLYDVDHAEAIVTTFSCSSQAGFDWINPKNDETLNGKVEKEITNEKIIKENVSVTAQQLGSSQVFNLQEDNEFSSNAQNSLPTITAFSSESQVSLNVDCISEGIPNNQLKSAQSVGVLLDNQIVSYPSCSQVINLVQEPSENLQVVDLVQIVSSGNTLPEETMVLLCLSSVPTPILAENFQNSTE